MVTQPVFVDTQAKPRLANSEHLKHRVEMLSATILEQIPRAQQLDVRADFVFIELSRYGDDYSYQDYDVQGVRYRNIIAKIKGTENCGTYVIGAHYDTYDELPGADDNASGTSGLIELAKLFSDKPPKCDVQLVAYTLEEPPYFRSEHMGSYIHAKSLKDKGVDVKMMISLEMIGYFSDEADSQNYPVKGMQYLYSNKGDFISIVGDLSQIGLTRFLKKAMRRATDLPVYSINAPASVQGIDFSDHLNYWQFDYPAVMVTDTAFNRNKNYHTKDDTSEKLDYKRMAKVVDGVYYAVLEHMHQ